MKTKVLFWVLRCVGIALVTSFFAPSLMVGLKGIANALPWPLAVIAIAAIIYTIVVGGTILIATTVDGISIKSFLPPSPGYSQGFWWGNIPIVLLVAAGIVAAKDLPYGGKLDFAVSLLVVIVYVVFESIDGADYAEAGARFNAWNKVWHDLANYGLMYYLALRAMATLLVGYGHEVTVAMLVVGIAFAGIGYAIGFNICRYHPAMIQKPDYSATSGKEAQTDDNQPASSDVND